MEPTIFLCCSSSKTIFWRGVCWCSKEPHPSRKVLCTCHWSNTGEGRGRTWGARILLYQQLRLEALREDAFHLQCDFPQLPSPSSPDTRGLHWNSFSKELNCPKWLQGVLKSFHTGLLINFKVSTFLNFNKKAIVAMVRNRRRKSYSLWHRAAEQVLGQVQHLLERHWGILLNSKFLFAGHVTWVTEGKRSGS